MLFDSFNNPILFCMNFLFSGGRTIIFTETKDSASTLAGVLPGARALHGDIQQATREVNSHTHTHTHAHIYIYLFIFIYITFCFFVKNVVSTYIHLSIRKKNGCGIS